MPLLEVRELGLNEYTSWDELVNESPYGTIFHSSFWLTACSRALGNALKIYGCFEGGRLIAGCSLFILGPKKADATIRMTPYGGIVMAPLRTDNVRRQEEANAAIIKCLTQSLVGRGYQYLRLVNPPGVIDVRPFLWTGWDVRVYYTYYFDLEGKVEDRVSKDVRWAARKAVKNNITVRRLEKPDVSKYDELFSMTFARKALTRPAPSGFLREMFRTLADEEASEMWVAETPSGDLACAEVILRDSKRAYRWSAASHTEHRGTGATALLLCEIFRDLQERNVKEIDLMAANTPVLAKFIGSFNPRLVPFYQVDRKTRLAIIREAIHRVVRRI
jgi:hypothetical protein